MGAGGKVVTAGFARLGVWRTVLVLLATVTVPPSARGELTPGDHEFTIEYSAPGQQTLTRTYDVHVPPGYDGSIPAPLVVDLHGFTSNEDQQAAISGFNGKSDQEGFIVVHPRGYSVLGNLNSWNAGDVCCGAALSLGLDDVGLVRAIVAEVVATGGIDRTRIYATGLSNGGAMSHLLACEAADLFAASAPVAFPIGLNDLNDCQPSRAMPVMHFHGFNDGTVPYDGGEIGPNLFVVSAPGSFDYWGQVNGCDTGQSVVTFTQGISVCEKYTGCDDGIEVGLCSIDGPHVLYFNPGNISIVDHAWGFLTTYGLGVNPVAGKKVVVRDKDEDATKRKVIAVLKDETLPAPTLKPTDVGAIFDVFNPQTGERDTYVLDQARWIGLGDPPGSKGYKYLDKFMDDGPCKVVLLKPGKLLRAVCKGDDIDFTLDEPGGQGAIAVRLLIGGVDSYCAMFSSETSAEIKKDNAAADGKIGVFIAINGQAPANCPQP
jgi:polyhydroxybutyrate depolymerase